MSHQGSTQEKRAAANGLLVYGSPLSPIFSQIHKIFLNQRTQIGVYQSAYRI